MTDLRSRPGDIIDQVQMGKTFDITKAGKKVATLSKPEPNAFELGAAIRRLARTAPEKSPSASSRNVV
jgi:antitoxin (DNA-binding transcriptional repressor) of toxin-antitoxin stability system